jgi:uncharacterized protein with PIN domain
LGVPCPGCGRQYDVTLFEFGRTLWCTCGSRVALGPRERRLAGPEPRFIADAMLGRLARWLRLLGVDCAFEEDIPDERLVRRALGEGRVVLSRDRALPEEWRISHVYLLRSESLREQLAEVVRAFGLADHVRPLTRCSRCNEELRSADPAEVAAHVPAGVLERQQQFAVCPACGRVYWEGSHGRRIRRVAKELLT